MTRSSARSTPATFAGFAPAALTFLRGLRRHNTKLWFEAHRSAYESALLLPLRALAEELDVRFATLAPEFVGDPKRSLFRIHRDVRFSNDKSPYKTHAALWVFHRAPGRGVGREAHGGAGFYFHLEPGASLVAGGLWMPPRPGLDRVRTALDEDPLVLARLVKAKRFRDRFGGLTDDDPGVRLQRVPRGYAPDHPAAEWLRFNSFTASRPLTDAEALSPALVDTLMADYAVLLPLCRWLNETLGYPRVGSR